MCDVRTFCPNGFVEFCKSTSLPPSCRLQNSRKTDFKAALLVDADRVECGVKIFMSTPHFDNPFFVHLARVSLEMPW